MKSNLARAWKSIDSVEIQDILETVIKAVFINPHYSYNNCIHLMVKNGLCPKKVYLLSYKWTWSSHGYWPAKFLGRWNELIQIKPLGQFEAQNKSLVSTDFTPAPSPESAFYSYSEAFVESFINTASNPPDKPLKLMHLSFIIRKSGGTQQKMAKEEWHASQSSSQTLCHSTFQAREDENGSGAPG